MDSLHFRTDISNILAVPRLSQVGNLPSGLHDNGRAADQSRRYVKRLPAEFRRVEQMMEMIHRREPEGSQSGPVLNVVE